MVDSQERSQLVLAIRQATSATKVSYFMVPFFVWIPAGSLETWALVGWGVLVYVALFARSRILPRLIGSLEGGGDVAAAQRVFTLWTAILALSVGLLPIISMRAMEAPERMLLTTFYCCFAAVVMSALGAAPRTFMTYLTILLGSLVFGWVLADLSVAIKIFPILALFWFLFRAFVGNFSRTINDRIALWEENQKLIQELSLAKAQAELANDSKTRFLLAAAHDLRQPLHAIGMLSGVLGRARDPSSLESARAGLVSSLANLHALFDAVLDVTKIDAGGTMPSLGEYSLPELLSSLDHEFGALANGAGRRWNFSCQDATLTTDKALLLRVVRNLLDNAFKHGAGAVTMSADVVGPDLIISVEDEGPGIPSEHREHVFAEFYRIPSRSHPIGGLGLGLSLVRRLTSLMGYSLEIQDVASGLGIRLVLRIPQEFVSTRKLVEGPAPFVTQEDLHLGMSVLLLDDDPQILASTALLLGQWGCEVTQSTSARGIDAACAALMRPPDVALIDFRLGTDESGLQAIQPVRVRYPSMSVVVLTGESNALSHAAIVDSGLPVIEKPVRPEDLYSVLLLLRSMPE